MCITQKENQILADLFSTASKEEILSKIPDKSWDLLRGLAYQQGLKRTKFSRNIPKNSFSKLLEDVPQSYYWVGFLLADGSISNKGQLSVTVSGKDKEHIDKFSNYVDTRISKIKKNNFGQEYCKVILADKAVAKKFTKKFGFNSQKTLNPPQCLKFYYDLDPLSFLSLLIGFIDGDGCIRQTNSRGKKRNKCAVQFQVHKNWLNFLTMLKIKLSEISKVSLPCPKINKRGYTYWSFGKKETISLLRETIQTTNITVLERKWSMVKEFYNAC